MNLVHATRNHPCIVMWSAGNEVPDQWGSEGEVRLKQLQYFQRGFYKTCNCRNGPGRGCNEKWFWCCSRCSRVGTTAYIYSKEAYECTLQGFLGSETASTVSSRGVYKFPVVSEAGKTYPDLQCSSYDLEYCNWSNIPEVDFAMQDDHPWVIGEFVWTGFDYLGEPTPYDTYWPSRSSYFGICDLVGIPKDRYYLYRSRWNKNGRNFAHSPPLELGWSTGETTPIFVYTNYNSAELL